MKLFHLLSSARDRASRTTEESVRNSVSASCGGWARVQRQVLGLALLICASGAHAGCTIVPGWTINSPTFVALSGNYTVSPSAPNGTVIATFYAATFPANVGYGSCPANSGESVTRAITVQPRPAVNLTQAIFESGVPGIGIQLRSGDGTKIPPWTVAISSIAQGMGVGSPQFQIQIVKTGPVGSGSINAADIPRIDYILNSSNTIIYYLAATGSLNITVPGCTVTAPTVPLGTHSIAEFTGTGYTTAPIDFNVTLSNCPTAGFIFYQFDDVNGYESMAQSIVKLQSGTGFASGLGVQLLNATTLSPSPMGAPQPLTTGPSNFSLPFKARFYQTASTVTTGIAKAAIGITLTYN